MKRGGKNGGGRRGEVALSRPPQHSPAIRVQKVFRYSTSAAVASNITVALLLDSLCVATTATAATRLIKSFRLIKVEAWNLPAQGAAGGEIVITGAGAGPENRKADVSMGVTPAHVIWRPAPNSPSAFWQQSGTSEANVLFVITAPTVTVVDLTMEIILQCDDAPTAVTSTVAGATAGTVYLAPMDGVAGNKILPVDYVTLP